MKKYLLILILICFTNASEYTNVTMDGDSYEVYEVIGFIDNPTIFIEKMANRIILWIDIIYTVFYDVFFT